MKNKNRKALKVFGFANKNCSAFKNWEQFKGNNSG